MLLSTGVSPKALQLGINNEKIKGLPKSLTADKVESYMIDKGLDRYYLEALSIKLPCREPIDYVKEATDIPGEIMEMDNIDASFSRMRDQDKKIKVVISLGGYKDAVVAVDCATGFAAIVGRISKSNPHEILEQFIIAWLIRWGCLKIVKLDKEFVTAESLSVVQHINFEKGLDIKLRQSVPGDHSRGTAGVEGGTK